MYTGSLPDLSLTKEPNTETFLILVLEMKQILRKCRKTYRKREENQDFTRRKTKRIQMIKKPGRRHTTERKPSQEDFPRTTVKNQDVITAEHKKLGRILNEENHMDG